MALIDKTSPPQPGTFTRPLPSAFPAMPEDVLSRFPALKKYESDVADFWRRTRSALYEQQDDTALRTSRALTTGNENALNITRVQGDFTALVSTEIQALVDADSALAERTEDLEAALNTADTGLLARVSEIESAYVDASGAYAEAESAITASLNSATAGSIGAAVTTAAGAYVTPLGALAERTTDLEASIDTAETGLLARVSEIESAYVDASGAYAEAESAITASLSSSLAGSIGAAVTTESTARAGADGTLAARYSLEVNVNGHVAGMRVGSTLDLAGQATTEIIFLADKFQISTSANSAVAPFSVVNGVVRVNGALVVEGPGNDTIDLETLAGNAALPGVNFVGTYASEQDASAYVGTVNSVYVNSTNGNSYISNGSTWVLFVPKGAPGNDGSGTNGLNNASVYIYKRSATAPTLPSVDTTYTFADGSLSGLNNGWTRTIPAGTDPLYVSVAVASATTATYVIASTAWSTAVKLVENGAPGANGNYTEYVFRRSAGAPATPTGNDPVDWDGAPPAGTDPLWMSLATKSYDGVLIGSWTVPVRVDGAAGAAGEAGDSYTVEYSVDGVSNWHPTFNPAADLYARTLVNGGSPSSAFRIVGEKGDDGDDGNYTEYVFKRAATQPATPAGNTPDNTWFDAPPAAGAFGEVLWISRGTKTGAGVLVGTWSPPVQVEGNSILIEYSVNGTTGWHPTFVPGEDLYARTTASGQSPSTAFRIVGENGADGDDGVSVATVYLYQRKATQPLLPSGNITYDFTTKTPTGMTNGWGAEIPPSDGTPLWVISATAASATSTDVLAPTEWTDPPVILVQDGTAGLNRAQVFLYQRAAAQPSVPSATITYNFETLAMTPAPNNGWSQQVPAVNGHPLWVTTAAAVSAAATDDIETGDWAAPVVLVQDGADGRDGQDGTNGQDGQNGVNGLSVASLYLYKRLGSPPAGISGSLTYDFSTKSLTGNLEGWSTTIPGANGAPLWVTTATAASADTVDVINANEWAAPTVLAEDGDQGDPGLNNATVYIYKRAAAQPAKPVGTATYIFETKALSGLDPLWSTTIPTADGNPLWVAVGTFSSTGASDTLAGNEWTDPSKLAENGTNGTNGFNNLLINLYRRAPAGAPPASVGAVLTYTFSTKTLSGSLNGWSRTIPASDGNPLWTISATALSQTDTDTIAPAEWSDPPTVLVQDGANGAQGANSAVVAIYKRVPAGTLSNSALLNAPSQNVTYTFGAGTASGINNGWAITPPAGTDPLWARYATAVAAAASDVLLPGEWSGAVQLVENGANGLSVAQVNLYRRSFAEPARPTNNSTFTFSTSLLALNVLDNAWSQTIPTADGNPVWVTSAAAASTGATDTILPAEWSTPTKLAENGPTGATGPRGSKFFYVTANAWSNALAETAITAQGLTKVANDAVFMSNGTSFADQRYWSATANDWVQFAQYINGNLIVNGSIEANKLSVGSLSAISANLGSVTIAAGAGYLRSGQTAYNNGSGFFLGWVPVGETQVCVMSLGNSSGDKLLWTGSALEITGKLTGTSGTIGGFTIGAASLSAGAGVTSINLRSDIGRIELGTATSVRRMTIGYDFISMTPLSGDAGGFGLSQVGLLLANTLYADSTNGNITTIGALKFTSANVNVATDVSLFRRPGVGATETTPAYQPGLATDSDLYVGTNAATRYLYFPNGGHIQWGVAGVMDTKLYRETVNTLKTDGSLTALGSLSVGGGTSNPLKSVAGRLYMAPAGVNRWFFSDSGNLVTMGGKITRESSNGYTPVLTDGSFDIEFRAVGGQIFARINGGADILLG